MRRVLWTAGVFLAGLAVVGGWVWVSLFVPYQNFAAPACTSISRTALRAGPSRGCLRAKAWCESLGLRSFTRGAPSARYKPANISLIVR